jgi:predicted nucleic acid-binding protein
MRVYIDLSCFNRPFDDQRQERIRRETQAMLAILSRIVDGTDTLVWSWVLTFENDKHPKRDRREEIGRWEARAERTVGLSAPVIEHAGQITSQGIQALDAAHLASAEAAGADIFVTCDDAVLRRARRLSLALRVLNPVAYLTEVEAHG